MSNHLGLPLEYQQMPEYFDTHNISADTDNKNAVIESLLKQHKVHTVLDLTCGTGCQVFFLKKRGYDITGSDFSPALLEIARKKAKESHIDVTFIDGDMRDVQVGAFDAVITIFNAIGHLTKEEFQLTLQNIHSNLKEGGIYIFDIFNLEALTDDVINNMTMDIQKEINGVNLHNTQYSSLDRAHGLLTSYDHYTIKKDEEETQTIENNFTLQIYTPTELNNMLSKQNFNVLGQYDMEGRAFTPTAQNILTVAQKQ